MKYKNEIKSIVNENNFIPLLPCFLIDNLNLNDFKEALEKEIFVGAKLYPNNATTNSSLGVTKIEKIFPALEILENMHKPLLVHGEKVSKEVDIFDREKLFIDEDLISCEIKGIFVLNSFSIISF